MQMAHLSQSLPSRFGYGNPLPPPNQSYVYGSPSANAYPHHYPYSHYPQPDYQLPANYGTSYNAQHPYRQAYSLAGFAQPIGSPQPTGDPPSLQLPTGRINQLPHPTSVLQHNRTAAATNTQCAI